MRLRKYFSYVFLAMVIFWGGCSEETRQRLEPTPVAIGSLNQLAVIADREIWEGGVGDSVHVGADGQKRCHGKIQ